MFEAIQYVGTPIALVAFIVAVVAYAYRGRLEERRKTIESAPEQDRARVAEATLRDFAMVPTENLTREQRYNLALQLIEERRAKFRSMTIVSVIVAALLTAVVVLFTLVPDGDGAGPLTIRVLDPARASVPAGSVTIDAGESTETRALDAQGTTRFENIPDAAFKTGVRVAVRAPGYESTADTTLLAVPRGRVHEVRVTPASTRVQGTVIDAQRQPLAGIVLDFEGGTAIDTTDAQGNFSVSLPYPPGKQVPVRATRGGVTGLHDQITIPDGGALTLLFESRT